MRRVYFSLIDCEASHTDTDSAVFHTYIELPVACLSSESKTGSHFKFLTSCFQIYPVCFLSSCRNVNIGSKKLHLSACVELQH